MNSSLRCHLRRLAAGLIIGAGIAAPVYAQPPAAPTELTPAPAAPAAPAIPEASPPVEVVAPVVAAPTADGPKPLDWSKVPRDIRPLPRPGNFILLPDGPGYFSVLDLLRGEKHEKAPKSPYPPVGPSVGSFFDADYRYLDDPNNTQHDWLDFLKRRELGDNWMLSTGGEFRYRYMDEHDSRLTGVKNEYDLIRTRVYGDAWYKDRLRFYVEFIDAHAFNESLAPLAIDNNTADFLNLFADIKLFDRLGTPAYLRIGRQELLYGSERLISPLDWANTRRTFQGSKIFWSSEKLDVDAFWVKPVPVNPAALDWWNVDQNFYGAWATYKPKKGTTRDFYILNFNQAAPLVPDGAGRATGPFDVTTFGTRWAGDRDGRLLYDFEAMGQTGIRANEEIYAAAGTAGLGWRAKDLPMTPTAWIYYDYASGTANPAANGRSQTFNQLFPFGHYYFGFLDLVGRQNIQDLNAHFTLYPSTFMFVQFQYHHFALAQAKDALYNAGGVAIRQDVTGASGKDVGDEFDLVSNIHVSQHSDVLFGFSYLSQGPFLLNAPGNAASKTQVPSLLYVQYCFKW